MSAEINNSRQTVTTMAANTQVQRVLELVRQRGIVRGTELDRLGVHRMYLKRLVDRGVLARHLYCERPPRYEYRLTEMGVALSPALVALMRWGDQWLTAGSAPTVLVHESCGNPLDQQFVCWECDETFTPYDIASRPGPGAT